MRDVLGKSEKAFLQKEKEIYSQRKDMQEYIPTGKAFHMDNLAANKSDQETDSIKPDHTINEYDSSIWARRWKQLKKKPFKIFLVPFKAIRYAAGIAKNQLGNWFDLHVRYKK